ncbi:hypothetical protein MKX01_020365 [Papaver californicum]|nr:hypothetical protein MKX01_020365 [Papaver californicum]
MAEAEIEVPPHFSEGKESAISEEEEEEAQRGLRGPVRCRKGGWTAEEDEYLRKGVKAYKGKGWKIIASGLPHKSAVQCLHRWKKVLHPDINKGPWSQEEDKKLIELVSKPGPIKWSVVAKSIPGRIGKQCRERWHNTLDPNIKKEAWTKDEEFAIVRAHRVFGNQWASIAKFLPGRTDNAIKNLWNCSLKKRLDSYPSAEQLPPVLKTGEDNAKNITTSSAVGNSTVCNNKGLDAIAGSFSENENSMENLWNAPLQKNLDIHLSTGKLPSSGSVLKTGEANATNITTSSAVGNSAVGNNIGLNTVAGSCLGNENSIKNLWNTPLQKNLDIHLSTGKLPSSGSVIKTGKANANNVTKSSAVGNSAMCNNKGLNAATERCLENDNTVKNFWYTQKNLDIYLSTGKWPPFGSVLRTGEDNAKNMTTSSVVGNSTVCNNKGLYANAGSCLGNENSIKFLWNAPLQKNLDIHLSTGKLPSSGSVLKTGIANATKSSAVGNSAMCNNKGLDVGTERCLGNDNTVKNLWNTPLKKNLDIHPSTGKLPPFGSVLTTGEDNAQNETKSSAVGNSTMCDNKGFNAGIRSCLRNENSIINIRNSSLKTLLDFHRSAGQSPAVGSVLKVRGDYAKKVTKSSGVGNSAVCNNKGLNASTHSCLNGNTVKKSCNSSSKKNFDFHLSTGELPPVDTVLNTEDYALQISISPAAGKISGCNNEGFNDSTQCSLGNEDFYTVDERCMDLVEPSIPEFLDAGDPTGVLATDLSNSVGLGCRQLASEHEFSRSKSKPNLVKYRSIAGTPLPISVPVTGSLNQETSDLTSVLSPTVCLPPVCVNGLVDQRVESLFKNAAKSFSNLPSILRKRKREASGTRNREEHTKEVQDEKRLHSLEMKKADNIKEKPGSTVVNLERDNTSCRGNSTVRMFYSRKVCPYGLRQKKSDVFKSLEKLLDGDEHTNEVMDEEGLQSPEGKKIDTMEENPGSVDVNLKSDNSVCRGNSTVRLFYTRNACAYRFRRKQSEMFYTRKARSYGLRQNKFDASVSLEKQLDRDEHTNEVQDEESIHTVGRKNTDNGEEMAGSLDVNLKSESAACRGNSNVRLFYTRKARPYGLRQKQSEMFYGRKARPSVIRQNKSGVSVSLEKQLDKDEHANEVQDEESLHTVERKKTDNGEEMAGSLDVDLNSETSACRGNSTVRLVYTRKARPYASRQNKSGVFQFLEKQLDGDDHTDEVKDEERLYPLERKKIDTREENPELCRSRQKQSGIFYTRKARPYDSRQNKSDVSMSLEKQLDRDQVQNEESLHSVESEKTDNGEEMAGSLDVNLKSEMACRGNSTVRLFYSRKASLHGCRIKQSGKFYTRKGHPYRLRQKESDVSRSVEMQLDKVENSSEGQDRDATRCKLKQSGMFYTRKTRPYGLRQTKFAVLEFLEKPLNWDEHANEVKDEEKLPSFERRETYTGKEPGTVDVNLITDNSAYRGNSTVRLFYTRKARPYSSSQKSA